MYYLILCFSLLASSLHTSTICGDEKLPAKFQFPQAIETPPFKVEVQLVEGKKPKRGQGKMVVDGVVTRAAWPERLPVLYKISEQFFLIHDSYNGVDLVWDTKEKQLEAVGRLSLYPAKGLGLVCYRYDSKAKPPTMDVCDFDLVTGKPRVLYRNKFSEVGTHIGVWKEGLLLSRSKAGAISIQPGKTIEELSFDLKGYKWSSGDSIRGNTVLLFKATPPAYSGSVIPPYKVDVAILDLTTKLIKPIGKFNGGWTTTTAVAHPSYSLNWITPQEAKNWRDQQADQKELGNLGHFASQFLGTTTGLVEEGTETLLNHPDR